MGFSDSPAYYPRKRWKTTEAIWQILAQIVNKEVSQRVTHRHGTFLKITWQIFLIQNRALIQLFSINKCRPPPH
jgi:hypothetical protein